MNEDSIQLSRLDKYSKRGLCVSHKINFKSPKNHKNLLVYIHVIEKEHFYSLLNKILTAHLKEGSSSQGAYPHPLITHTHWDIDKPSDDQNLMVQLVFC